MTMANVPIEKRPDFEELARRALSVMMRRCWSPRKDERTGAWVVDIPDLYGLPYKVSAADPFTALLEADFLVESDQWYKEHVESQPAKG